MPTLEQARCGARMQIGSKRDDQDVGVEGPSVCLDALGDWIDRSDRGLDEPHPGLHEIAVRMPHGRWQCPPEHDVQLREPEDEAITLIDEHDVNIAAEFLRQPCCQLKTAEPRSENHNPHARRLSAQW